MLYKPAMLEIVERAARAMNGAARLAALLNITRQAIYQWDRVPVDHVLAIEGATGIPRYELRPDIYPPPGDAQ